MNLYRLHNGIGDYWVVATDPTQAESKLKEVLDHGSGYGFSSDRQVTQINLIAESIEKSSLPVGGYDLTKKFFLP